MLGEANPELVVDETRHDRQARQRRRHRRARHGLRARQHDRRRAARSGSGTSSNDRAGIARFRANDLADAPDEPDLGQRRALRLPGDLGLRPDHQRVEPDARHPPDRRRQRHAERRSSRSTSSTSRARRTARPTTSRSTRPTRPARRSSSTSRTASRRRWSRSATSRPAAIANSDIVLEGRLTTPHRRDDRRHDREPDRHDDHRQPARQHHRQPTARPFLLLRTNVLTLNADGGSIGTHTRSTGGVITARAPIPRRADPVRRRGERPAADRR